MPYASKAQAAFFHANKAKLEKQGVDVGEWDRATDFKNLPAKKAHAMELLATQILKKADYGMPGQPQAQQSAPWYRSPGALAAGGLLAAGAGGLAGMELQGHSPHALADLFTPGEGAAYPELNSTPMAPRPAPPQIDLGAMSQGAPPAPAGSFQIGDYIGGTQELEGPASPAPHQLQGSELRMAPPQHGQGGLPLTWMQHPMPGR